MKGRIKHIFKYLLIVPVALATAFACSKYDSPENLHFTSYGIAYKYDGGGAVADYYIMRDDGARLYIKDNLWSHVEVADGQRVSFNYEILDSFGEAYAVTAASGKSYDIKLYILYDVPMRKPVTLSFINDDETHRQDSIGDDPFGQISRMFFSGKYLNVKFKNWQRRNTNIMHNINLVVDDLGDDADEVTVWLRHNGNGDVPEGRESNFVLRDNDKEVSFDIGALIPEGKSSVRMKFVWREFRKEKVWDDVVEQTETRVFSLDPNSNKQIVGAVEGDGLSYQDAYDVR